MNHQPLFHPDATFVGPHCMLFNNVTFTQAEIHVRHEAIFGVLCAVLRLSDVTHQHEASEPNNTETILEIWSPASSALTRINFSWAGEHRRTSPPVPGKCNIQLKTVKHTQIIDASDLFKLVS